MGHADGEAASPPEGQMVLPINVTKRGRGSKVDLHAAAEKGDERAVRELVDAGADVLAVDKACKLSQPHLFAAT